MAFIGLQEADVRGVMVETWETHKVSFEIHNESITQKNAISLKQQIILRSKTAKVKELQDYIETICQHRQNNSCLRIYRAVVENGNDKKPTRTYWSMVNAITNKRIDNTILSESAENNLYNDIDWFLHNQKLYDTQGIPYQRGYFLYGVPGTGKTSCIKAIANEYQLDIFSIQMNDLTDNSQFTLLMTRITELTGNRPYILALEDFDRAALFDSWRNSTKLSIGNILNELDGVCETFGRLLFITANTRERFNNQPGIDALFRPGRIDKEIQLDYCDKYQLERMVQHFSGVELKLPSSVVLNQLTPAKVISVLQQYIGQDRQVLQCDINNCEFWNELQKDTDTFRVKTIGNKAVSNLEKRISRKRSVITRYNRTIRVTSSMDKTKERRDKAQEQLKKMRALLVAKKRKIRQDVKKK
uniref:AAA family ATPase n=1 Tax=Marseillevirus LCMAC201 TaxID=2506605 RepID=A0A481YW37_9VIRU|nr:MAG: AAA family ATPase [Marseillevirus LCMAC201]